MYPRNTLNKLCEYRRNYPTINFARSAQKNNANWKHVLFSSFGVRRADKLADATSCSMYSKWLLLLLMLMLRVMNADNSLLIAMHLYML